MKPLHLVIAVATTTMSVGIVYIPQSVFTGIAGDLGISTVTARDTFTISALSYALAFFIFGPLSDVLSARVLGSVGGIATAVCAGLAACMNSFPLFITMVAVTGFCAASVPSAMFALVGRVKPGQAGRYFGFILAATVAGITIGRGLGGILTGGFGWRWAYVLFAAATLLLGLFSLVLPRASGYSQSIPRAYATALRMVARPDVLGYLGIGGALFFGYLGMTTVLTLRLGSPPMSLDSTAIGLISLSGLIALAGAPLAGALVPKIGAKTVSLLGLAVCLLGVAVIGVATTPWASTVGLLILYLGVFAAQPALMVRLTQLVGIAQKGSASASYFLACLLAGSLGGSVLGLLWQEHGWALTAAISAAAIIFALVLAGIRRDASRSQAEAVVI